MSRVITIAILSILFGITYLKFDEERAKHRQQAQEDSTPVQYAYKGYNQAIKGDQIGFDGKVMQFVDRGPIAKALKYGTLRLTLTGIRITDINKSKMVYRHFCSDHLNTHEAYLHRESFNGSHLKRRASHQAVIFCHKAVLNEELVRAGAAEVLDTENPRLMTAKRASQSATFSSKIAYN